MSFVHTFFVLRIIWDVFLHMEIIIIKKVERKVLKTLKTLKEKDIPFKDNLYLWIKKTENKSAKNLNNKFGAQSAKAK